MASLLEPAPAEAAARLTISSGGLTRAAVLVERERLKLRRRPLVIVLQRSGGVVARGRRHHGLEQAAGAKAIFVYPEALGGKWPLAAGAESDRDVTFLHQLADRLVTQGRADARKIFVVGIGSGGPLAYRAACAGLGRPVTGLAAIASAMPQDLSCAPPPLAYIAVNNAHDAKIPFAGGKATMGDLSLDVLGAEQSLQTFARINGCGARREARDARTRGAVATFAGCKAPTELIRLDASGHHLPGRAADGEGAADYFDANRAVWEFLQRGGA